MSARFLILAAAAAAVTAGTAQAQFFPRFGPQMPTGIYVNSPLGGYYFNTVQQYQYSFSGIVNGRPISVNYQYYWSGIPRNNFYYAPSYSNPYSSSMSGGFGSYGSNQFNPIAERQRAALARAQRAADDTNVNVLAGRKDEIDNWVAAQNRGGNEQAPAPQVIDPNLIDPPDEAVLSGRSLNELLALCQARVKDGRKADSGLCPPDLLEKVAFDGGAAASALNLFRLPNLPYPVAVMVPETAKLRTPIDTEFAAIGQALRGGKKPNASSIDRLDTALAAARKAFADRLKDAPFAEEKAVNDFFTQLEAAAKFARDADAPALIPAGWHTVGASVGELVKHMDRFKLRFAAAPVGGEPAYLSLHRGLLGYYVRLTPVAKK
jgi:hypothetical protein